MAGEAVLVVYQHVRVVYNYWPLLVIGYALQYVGHRHEGNDMGEIVLLKRLLGRPYVAVSPRYHKRQ